MPDERDPLTGLIGWDAAMREIAGWQEEARAAGRDVRVHALLLRLRRFSSVNLAFGEAAGNRALAEVAARIDRLFGLQFGPERVIARVGGGAFLLASAQPGGAPAWERLAEQLARSIAGPITDQGGETMRLRPRIALMSAEIEERPERMLARLADTLDHAKHQTGRLLLWVDGGIVPGHHQAQQLEADLPGALDRGEIEVVFQPQFAAADNALVGAEALARWQHPALGTIGAEALFAIAERADQGAPLSRHIAQVALAAAARWPEPLRLSLNVTAADLAATDFAAQMEYAVAKAGFSPGRLILEITEQTLVLDLERSARQLERLASTGIRIALDDFGAGFCNFRYLKVLPLHGLKLDRSMVEGIADDERDLAVLRGIVAMASALGLSVVAEGIETEPQRAAIAREGCAAWQGYLGATPLEAEAFKALAEAG